MAVVRWSCCAVLTAALSGCTAAPATVDGQDAAVDVATDSAVDATDDTPPDTTSDPTGDDADRLVFRTDRVHQIDFVLSDQATVAIQAADRPEVHAAMTIDGETFPDVGLKLKGSSSYDTLDGKPAFSVDMNEWVKGTRYHGLKAFKLNNGSVLDPTRTHEWLAYTLARAAGLMAPRVGWAEVRCNDAALGIYMLVEKHDDVMIAHHDPDQADVGVVLDPENTFADLGIGAIPAGDDTLLRDAIEEGPEPVDPAVLQTLRDADALLAQEPTELLAAALWEHIDRVALLDYLAWQAVSTHLDGYTNLRNYRLFVDGRTYLIAWLPSGADNTFHSRVDAFFTSGEAGRAHAWCLSLSSCRRAYAERVLAMAARVESLELLRRYRELNTLLDPYIQADPRAPFTPEQVEEFRAYTEARLSQGPGDARADIRAEYPELVP